MSQTAKPEPACPPPICLVGARGSGKSTVGRLLAERLDRAFVDLDRALEKRTASTISALFATGEANFRALEAETLDASLSLLAAGVSRPCVVATGGGVVLLPQNRALLKALARVVYLDAPAEVLAARVEGDETEARPPLAEGGPLAEAQAVLGVRDPLYREVADLVIDARGTPETVVDALLAFTRP